MCGSQENQIAEKQMIINMVKINLISEFYYEWLFFSGRGLSTICGMYLPHALFHEKYTLKSSKFCFVECIVINIKHTGIQKPPHGYTRLMPAPLTFFTQVWLVPGGWREPARLLARTGAHLSPGTTLFLLAATAVTWNYGQREASSFEISCMLVQLWNNINHILPEGQKQERSYTESSKIQHF